MALFKRGGGIGGNMGKGTKPSGGYGTYGHPTVKVGSDGKQSSQPSAGKKPAGKHGSYGPPKGTKPAGGYGTRSNPGDTKPKGGYGCRMAPAGENATQNYYKDRTGYSAPVPGGQGKGVNGIPNGQNNTPSVKVRLK